MTIEELISKLQELNTGASTRVLLGDGDSRFWDIDFEFSHVGTAAPYSHDNDRPMSLILRPK